MPRVAQKLNAETKPFRINNASYLKELKSTFDYTGVPSVYYSLEGYSEDAICIEHNDDNWIVYNGERGNRYNIKKYRNIQDACYNLILRLSESEEEYRQMRNVFAQKIKRYRHIVRQNQKIKMNEYIIAKRDTSLPEAQITILTARIQELTKHLKENPSDRQSRRKLLKMLGQRRGLLTHLKNIDIERYHNLVKKLGLIR